MTCLGSTNWQNTNFKCPSWPDKRGAHSCWKNQTYQNQTKPNGKIKPINSRNDSRKIREACVIYVTCFKNKQKPGTYILTFLWNFLLCTLSVHSYRYFIIIFKQMYLDYFFFNLRYHVSIGYSFLNVP